MTKFALPDEILLKIDKPARYIGNEVNIVRKDIKKIDIRFCMCFPDVYEVGMSHLGIQILYDMFNRRDDTYCERVYSPWPDLDKIMREKSIPLFSLETQEPIKNFDFLGITLQYEMCYTNILQILDLSGIAIFSKDRNENDPIIVGGGPCTYNPEPIADFFDFFYMGEGETQYYKILDIYKDNKSNGGTRKDFLRKISAIEGIYVPSLYNVEYNSDNTISAFYPIDNTIPDKVTKQVEDDLNNTYYPLKPLVPFVQCIQDRVVLEIQRGCIRGCRFCQAGMVYRPVRERSLDFLIDAAEKMLTSTGYDEISLSSLSSSDYSKLKELVFHLIETYSKKNINISLPSLRIDAFSLDVMSRVQDVKKSSLTFAPEAGTQRMRDVINKGITEENILDGAMMAFKCGWNKVKLYFMLGLPGETKEDAEEIAVLSDKIAREYYTIPKDERNGKVEITTSTSFFVPKPFTAFQWSKMATIDEFLLMQGALHTKIREMLNSKSIKYNWHDAETTLIEGILARGDRKLSACIYDVYKSGGIFDAWSDYFDFKRWMDSFEKNNIDYKFYVYRERSENEIFPWDFIDIGVSKKFLRNEYNNSIAGVVTPNCKAKCSGCGASKFKCGICTDK